ncbi:T9SS C-terminal target domain-containing protein [Rufibacter latericius]|uniref:T9SS C-terminal target domain-containing protein n=1 Tax=Rufibacter latericius TaxID=2487040 RepID=A0A3M9MW44_9BACT|nr:T9SS C-terminal target domain-containing protein [Rufibacter latericius]
MAVKAPEKVSFNASQPDFGVFFRTKPIPSPQQSASQNRFNAIKDSLHLLQKSISYVKGNGVTSLGTVKPPTVEQSFFGLPSPGIPNDDDLAVSNSGMVVSVMNGRIAIHDETGSILRSLTLSALVKSPTLTGFDPHVMYDPEQDRFLVVFLTGHVAEESQIHLVVSASADPVGTWHSYTLDGNPLNDDTWSDFPSLAVSKNEIFITANSFANGSTNNSGFRQSGIWQLNKQNVLAGLPLSVSDSRYFHSIRFKDELLFNITPVKSSSGVGTLPFYFLSNEAITASQSTKLLLLTLASPLPDQSAKLAIQECAEATAYTLPPNLRQKNSSLSLGRNDARVMQAYLHDDRIHFVMNALNTSEGNPRAGVYYGQISALSSPTPTVQSKMVPEERDAAFPTLAHIGLTEKDGAALLVYAHSSPIDFPGYSAVLVDAAGEFSSPLRVKEGEDYVAILGDYSGISRQYNKPGVVWAQGCVVVSTGLGGGGERQPHISKLVNPSILGSPPPTQNSASRLYPNPTADQFTITFNLSQPSPMTIALYTNQGSLVKVLLQEHVRAGESTLRFRTDVLANGTYLLSGTNANHEIIFQKRLVVTK